METCRSSHIKLQLTGVLYKGQYISIKYKTSKNYIKREGASMFNKKWGTKRVLAIIMSLVVLEPAVLSGISTVSYAEQLSDLGDDLNAEAGSSSGSSSSDEQNSSSQGSTDNSSGTGSGAEDSTGSEGSDNAATASSAEDDPAQGSSDSSSKETSDAATAEDSEDGADASSSASTGDSSDAASSASTGASDDETKDKSKTKSAVLGAGRTTSPMSDQGDDGYENFTSDTQVADFVFGTDGNISSEDTYSSDKGYGFSDVDYNTDPTGWSGGVYYERKANVSTGSASYVSDSENYLEIRSKVWTETESSGYGVYTYENTSTLDVDLYNADYKVEVTFANPTGSSYSAYLEAEDIGQVSGINISAGGEATASYEVSLIDGTLNMKFLASGSATSISDAATSSVYIKEVVITRLSTDYASSKPTLYVASDSTVQTYDAYYYPQTGWGQTFSNWFGDLVEEREAVNASFSQSQVYEAENATIENRSIGGRSSKSYVEEGKLEDILEDIGAGDYLFIQWGHNDATASRPNRYVSTSDFSKWIMMYVRGAYQRGATPILVTPVSRYSYTYDSNGRLTWKSDFEAYRQVMISLAGEYDIPIIDLTSRSGDICESLGAEGAKALFLTGVEAGDYSEGAYTGGSSDATHLQWYGAFKFSQAVAQGIVDYADNTDNEYKLVGTCNDQLDALASLVEITAATDAPSKVTGLEITSKGSTSVSLSWDSAEGAELYYIYRAVLEDGQKAEDIDFTKAEKYSVSSKRTYTDSNCGAGVTYVYAVAAYNSYGLGEVSDYIEATTKNAGYRFDFNYNSSPTMEGWNGVTQSQSYSSSVGYGWIKAPGNGRYRSGNGKADSSDMADDFCLGAGEFAVDIPNGSYEVTIYAGDLLPGTSTIKCAYTAEGVSIGSIACKQSLGSCTATVNVTDGQLNIVVGGTNNYINGLTITSLLTAPGNLTITELSFTDTTASFLFAFNTVEEAKSYTVYQKTSSDTDYSVAKTYTADELVEKDLDCRAMVADLGETYSYYMTCTTADGVESPASNIVTQEMIDPSVAVPGAVKNVECTSPKEDASELQNYISLSWDANDTSDKVIKYVIYRSDKAESDKGFKEFTKVGTTTKTTYTDKDDVATNIHYYYKVAAMNAGGIGELSEVCITPIVGTLVAGGLETYSSRQLVAISLSGSSGASTYVTATDSEGKEIKSGVYLSWRAYKGDFSGKNLTTTFTVYRNDVRIATNISVTNCIDEGGSSSDVYRVVGSNDSSLGLKTIGTNVWDNQYLELQLVKPSDQTMPDGSTCTYTANDMSVGDLDGDGELELIVKWYPSNAKDNSGSGYTGTTFLDAYDVNFATGACSLMWRIDMGINIRSGAHYTQFQVWDFDADGCAEIAVKTADGTTTYNADLQETGYVGACSMADLDTATISTKNDYRNTSGYVLDGPEYFTMFNGEDGTIIDTVKYTPERGSVSAWGDGYGNRVDRFLSCTAYLNGTTPFAVFCRGYYTRTCLTAYYLSTADDGTQSIGTYWTFDTNDAGSQYEGQGNHAVIVADVDNDDKDEIVYGSLTLDNDGSVLYSTGLGHGDAEHVSDFVSSNDGLEVMDVHEHDNATYHVEIHDAQTGEILTGYYTGKDTGRGMASDIDPTAEGAEYWSIADPSYSSNDEPSWNSRNASVYSGQSGVFNSSDTDGSNLIILTEGSTPAVNFSLYWDGDLLAEMQDHTFNSAAYVPLTTTIEKWDYENGISYTLFESSEVLTSNGTKGNLGLVGDILGDWRDEIVARCSDDASKIRIYSTTITTDYVIPCSLTDLQYREAIAWQNVGYNQPAHTSYLISEGLVTSKLSEGDVSSNSIDVLYTKACDGSVYGHDVEGYSVYRADVTVDSDGNETVGDYTKIGEIDTDDMVKASEGGSSSGSGSSESEPVYLKFDFGNGRVEDGYTQVLADTAYSSDTGYGFSSDTIKKNILSNKTYRSWTDEDNADLLYDSVFGFETDGSAEFDADLPNGTYEVTFIVANGSGAYYQAISCEGETVSTINNFRHGKSDITIDKITATVTVSDGTLNIVVQTSKNGYGSMYFTGIEIKDVDYDNYLSESKASSTKDDATNKDDADTTGRYVYTDKDVEAGHSYSYKIAAIVDGKDSYNSKALTITSGIDVSTVIDTDVSFDIPGSMKFDDDDALEAYIISLKETYAVKDQNGNVSNLAVKSIDVSKIDMSAVGSYKADVTLKGCSKTVEITVNVIENGATGYAKLDDITVIVGGSVTLPETVEATFLDGTSDSVNVTWDTSSLDLNKVGEYTLKGSVEGDENCVTVKVIVVDDYIVSADDVYVEAVYGSKVEDYLPDTVAATYYSGAVKQAQASYDTSKVDMNTSATYKVPGTINGTDVTFTLNLVVRYEALYSFDFGISSGTGADGWTTLTANPKGGSKTLDSLGLTYSKEKGYGFTDGTATCQGRSESYEYTQGVIPKNVYTDFIISDGQTFVVDVENGSYEVDVVSGSYYKSTVKATIEGTAVTVSNAASTYSIGTYTVSVTDGQLTIEFAAGATSRVDGIVIRKVGSNYNTPGDDPTDDNKETDNKETDNQETGNTDNTNTESNSSSGSTQSSGTGNTSSSTGSGSGTTGGSSSSTGSTSSSTGSTSSTTASGNTSDNSTTTGSGSASNTTDTTGSATTASGNGTTTQDGTLVADADNTPGQVAGATRPQPSGTSSGTSTGNAGNATGSSDNGGDDTQGLVAEVTQDTDIAESTEENVESDQSDNTQSLETEGEGQTTTEQGESTTIEESDTAQADTPHHNPVATAAAAASVFVILAGLIFAGIKSGFFLKILAFIR